MPNGGMFGTASEKRPEPGPAVEADEDRAQPTPAASRPGTQHDAEHRAAEAGRLHQQERADERRAEQRADRGEAAGGADHGTRLRGCVPLDQLHREHAEAAADRDQRRLRARARRRGSASRATRGRSPGSSIGETGPPALNPSAGLWPAGARAGSGSSSATSSPLSASQGSGHHTGALSNPSSSGSVVKTYCCASATPLGRSTRPAATEHADDRARTRRARVAPAPQQLDRVGRGRRRRRVRHGRCGRRSNCAPDSVPSGARKRSVPDPGGVPTSRERLAAVGTKPNQAIELTLDRGQRDGQACACVRRW